MTGPKAVAGKGQLADIKRALLDAKLNRQRAEAAERNRIVPVERTDRMEVSDQQRHLWLLQQLAPGKPVYNVPFALRLTGPLDVPALAKALCRLVARHEALRTRFGVERGVPYQLIDDAPTDWALPVTDLSELPPGDDEERVRRWVEDRARAPFDLAAGPVFHTHLLRLDATEHVLVLCVHHIVTDGWSVGVITRELAALYEGKDLTALAAQPVDHAAWQRKRLSGGALREQLDYWRGVLDGVPVVDFPTDRPRPTDPQWAGAELEIPLPAGLGPAVGALARAERVPLLAVLQAAFLVVLRRYTGQDDLSVGSVFSGRTRSEVEPMVGFFANTLVLRTSTEGDPTFSELIGRCGRTVLGALAHQDVPFGTLVEELRPERMPGRNPLFQISFTLLTGAMVGAFGFGGVAVRTMPVVNGTSRFDLAFQVNEDADGQLGVWLEYSTELFQRERMERLVRHFQRVLEQAVADPGMRASAIVLVDGDEREQLLHGWNPAPVRRAGDGLLLHELVAAQPPPGIAMRFAGAELSYGTLHTAANRLARMLRSEGGVGPDEVVGVLLERGLDLPVAQLGVMKAGGAWLPLDPQHPAERIAACVADAGATAVVTTRALAHLVPAGTFLMCLDDPRMADRLAAQSAEPPDSLTHPDHLAYVIYTSGSTGTPKGVMVSHRAAVNFVLNARDMFRISRRDRLLQFANPAFDVSVFDFYAALGSGATVVGAPRDVLLDPDRLQDLLLRERVTMGDVPPAVLRLLDPAPLTDLRALFVGLEAFPAELVNRWANEKRDFHNGYGPTEATVACVDYLCPPGGLTAAPPIGRAMDNHRAYVLDAEFEPVPVGVPGELFVAGTGLARGYTGRPDLTAERFLPDPFAGNGERMYRTGDVVRWRPDGNLEFLGRADRQVKIRGLRIEPGEIEHVLAETGGVTQAVVVVDEPGTPHARLIAYVVPDSDGQLDTEELRGALMDQLPQHMVPTRIIAIEALPLTANGKLDHARLPKPQGADQHTHVPPRTTTERELAALWHTLLDVPEESIGRDDGFFEHGGNSLQVTRLIARIGDVFEVTLELRTLFAHPVLKDLAAHIDRHLAAVAEAAPPRRDTDASALVPLRATGSRPPLFLVHAVGGEVVPYIPLTRLLDEQTPVHALEHPGLTTAGDTAYGFPELADAYLRALRQARPHGPYLLGGWSLGGSLALEIATRLRAAGEEVALLALFDTGEPPNAAVAPDEADLLIDFTRDLAGLKAAEPPVIDRQALAQAPEGERVDVLLPVLEDAGLVPAGVRDEVRTRIQVFLANARAYHVYRPSAYDGPITLFSAAAAPPEQAAWWHGAATAGLEHHIVPGTHHTMLQRPHVAQLARLLQRCLDRATEEHR